MAILRKGILGGFSGKVGPASGSYWRSRYILKSRSGKRIKGKKLLPQNYKLKVMSKFLKVFKIWIRIGFANKKEKNTPYTVAMKYNIHRALTGETPDYKIDYKKVVLSKGNRETAWSGKVFLEESDQIKITWEIPQTAKLKVIGNDRAIILIYNTRVNKVMSVDTAKRVDLSVVISIPIAYQRGTLEIWMFFLSPDGKSVSNTDYIGSVSFETEENNDQAGER